MHYLKEQSIYDIELPKFYEEIPFELLKKGYDLRRFGYAEIAWNNNDAILVISILASKNYVVCGGDILEIDLKTQKIKFSGNNWFIKNEKYNTKKMLSIGKETALKYINDFKEFEKDHDHNYIFTIVAIENI